MRPAGVSTSVGAALGLDAPPSPSSAGAAALAEQTPTRYGAQAHDTIPTPEYVAGLPTLRAPTIGELAYAEKVGMVVVLGFVLIWLIGRVFRVGPARAGGELAGGMIP